MTLTREEWQEGSAGFIDSVTDDWTETLEV